MALGSVGHHKRGYYLYLIPGFVGLIVIVIRSADRQFRV